MAVGAYKIALQTGKIAHFAAIELDVSPSGGKTIICFDCGEENVRGWRAAIEAGVASALEILKLRLLSFDPVRIDVRAFHGLVVDTDAHDAYAVALVATIRAVLPETEWPAVRKVDAPQRWNLEWPSSLP